MGEVIFNYLILHQALLTPSLRNEKGEKHVYSPIHPPFQVPLCFLTYRILND